MSDSSQASAYEADRTTPHDGADEQHGTGEDPDETDAADGATTGAEAAVAALEAAGVQHLFGVQGGAIMPVYDAIRDSGLTHVTMAHEQAAAHAADAYGIVSGRPGVCIATSGPGATNLVTGLADADMDSDPVVALTGQVPTDLVGTDAFQETDTTGMTRPLTKAGFFVGDPDEAGSAVERAVALATSGRQGPTLVDLPKDATTGETTGRTASETTGRTAGEPPAGAEQPTADPTAVARAVETIAAAERPVVLAGGGVVKADASDDLRTFARRYGVPVVTTMPAVGTYPEDEALSMGMAGMHGTGYANMALQHCDAMLAVGTRFDDRLTGGVETFAPEARVVHVDVDPSEISKNVHADHGLVGDAGAVLRQLDEAMPRAPTADDWRAQCREWKEAYPLSYEQSADGPVKPQFVVDAFDAATDDDAVVTTGVGQHQMWAVQYWTFREPRTWVSSHGLGTMGYGLPAAIGARYAADEEEAVVCFEGDGSFLMTLQELAVAVREHLDVTVAVLNNRAIGMVRQWQDAFFDGRRTASEYPWVPAFDDVAEAFGAKGFRATTPDEVADAVEGALAYDGPSVVDFHIDPTENVFPMVESGGDNGRFALAEEQL